MERKWAFPAATLALIALNVVIFVLLRATDSLEWATYEYGLRPAAILQGEHLEALLTSMFLHGDESHLLGNMLVLLVFGIILERRIGTPKFLLIYFLADFVASMVDLAVRSDPTSLESWVPAIGASAAISGVAGACFIGFPNARAPPGFLTFLISTGLALIVILTIPMPIVTAYAVYLLIGFGLPVAVFFLSPFALAPLWPFVLIWIIIQVGFGIFVKTLGVLWAGYWAHIAGFIAGMLLILLLKLREPGEEVKPREEIPAIR